MENNKKPFLGNELVNKSKETAIKINNEIIEFTKRNEQHLIEIEQVIVNLESLIKNIKEIIDQQDTNLISKEKLDEYQETLKNETHELKEYQEMRDICKDIISKSHLQNIRSQSKIENFENLQNKIKQHITENKPGQDN